MAKRLIGTGTTDNNGTATIQYTGTGAGKIDIVAEYTDGESIIQSEIYSIMDYIFYDTGVDGTKNTNWENYSNRLGVVTDENGTILTGNASSNGYYFANASDKFIFDEYTCEFIVVGTPSSSVRWYHQNTSNSNENVFTFNTGWFNQTENLVKITVENGVATLIVNGTERGTTTLTLTAPYEIGFRIATGTSNTITYKNFKIYPI